MTGRVRGLLFITALVVLFIPAYAAAKDNYCAECHTAREISSFGSLTKWDRSIYQQQKDTLCPGLFEIKKEQYFTESRLLKYDQFLTQLEEQTRRYPEYLRTDLVKYGVQYADLKSKDVDSIDSFAGPNLKIKKGMGEVYENINKLRDDYKMEKVIGFALLVVIIVSLLFFLGLKKTVKE
ncbi:MAG: hypothetical protein ACYDFU_05990 [Nitrospirota bacterium]